MQDLDHACPRALANITYQGSMHLLLSFAGIDNHFQFHPDSDPDCRTIRRFSADYPVPTVWSAFPFRLAYDI